MSHSCTCGHAPATHHDDEGCTAGTDTDDWFCLCERYVRDDYDEDR